MVHVAADQAGSEDIVAAPTDVYDAFRYRTLSSVQMTFLKLFTLFENFTWSVNEPSSPRVHTLHANMAARGVACGGLAEVEEMAEGEALGGCSLG